VGGAFAGGLASTSATVPTRPASGASGDKKRRSIPTATASRHDSTAISSVDRGGGHPLGRYETRTAAAASKVPSGTLGVRQQGEPPRSLAEERLLRIAGEQLPKTVDAAVSGRGRRRVATADRARAPTKGVPRAHSRRGGRGGGRAAVRQRRALVSRRGGAAPLGTSGCGGVWPDAGLPATPRRWRSADKHGRQLMPVNLRPHVVGPTAAPRSSSGCRTTGGPACMCVSHAGHRQSALMRRTTMRGNVHAATGAAVASKLYLAGTPGGLLARPCHLPQCHAAASLAASVPWLTTMTVQQPPIVAWCHPWSDRPFVHHAGGRSYRQRGLAAQTPGQAHGCSPSRFRPRPLAVASPRRRFSSSSANQYSTYQQSATRARARPE